MFGPAPYRFVGFESADDREAEQNARMGMGLSYTTNYCGGACDLCGTAIWNVYFFEAANGRRFKVGCECAEKAGEGRTAKEGRRNQERAAAEARGFQVRLERLDAERARNLADPTIGEALTNDEVYELTKMIQEFEDAAIRLASRHFGTPKQRIKKLDVMFDRSFKIETLWGIKYCYRMRTLDGNAITWWTSSGSLGMADKDGYWKNPEPGAVLTISGTVKKHTEYNDEQQTELQRIKVHAIASSTRPNRDSLPY